MDIEKVIREAEREYHRELFRKAVEEQKAKLRTHRTVWDRIWPWRIVVIRK